ncbi:RNA polymerase sigma-70 factor [soil metagenome]
MKLNYLYLPKAKRASFIIFCSYYHFMFCKNNTNLDAELVEGLKENDENAFKILYDQFQKPMYILAKHYVKDEEIAQDVLQEVFIKFWLQRNNLNPHLPIKNFLFTILKNHIFNTLRGRKREILKVLVACDKREPDQNFTDLAFRKNLFLDAFGQGVNALSRKRREIFELHTIDGLSSYEIAEKLGISVNTVKSQFTKANNFLKDYIRHYV